MLCCNVVNINFNKEILVFVLFQISDVQLTMKDTGTLLLALHDVTSTTLNSYSATVGMKNMVTSASITVSCWGYLSSSPEVKRNLRKKILKRLRPVCCTVYLTLLFYCRTTNDNQRKIESMTEIWCYVWSYFATKCIRLTCKQHNKHNKSTQRAKTPPRPLHHRSVMSEHV